MFSIAWMAEMTEISCSVLLPPNRTATLSFMIQNIRSKDALLLSVIIGKIVFQ